ncbi:hypothetical protein F5Y04DRAFT_213273 [Hypomontagnella monticulosa]|nr:hypothetical protein F5Y04DRAFT_213273 [Hypomontagnella monticulosa]
MVRITAALASLLASTAFASMDHVMGGMLDLRGIMLDDAATDYIQRRQDAPTTDASQGNLTQWNTDTLAACMASLSALNAATNPSGTAVCYNIFRLEKDVGTFMADLRLFQISLPFGEFQGIPPEDISVGLQYNGASVSPVGQGMQTPTPNITSRAANPKLLQTYMFVGQIDKDRMTQQPMDTGVLESLVMPIVTLTAKNGAQQVSTNVSSNEAAFVNGFFAGEIPQSDFTRASVAVSNITIQMQNGTVAFVLPGVNILIFPVGLVITSIWLAIGLGFYGFGTYERYNYRDTYRRRKARADGKPAYARI